MFATYGRVLRPSINIKMFATYGRVLKPKIVNTIKVQYCTAANPSKVKIYTKTGDKGASSLFTGERRSKTDEIFSVLGDTDELNAHLGVAAEHCRTANNGIATKIEEIQSNLLDIGAHIATPRESASQAHKDRTKFNAEHVKTLESWIDEMDSQLPALRNFILPGGGLSSAHLHVARAVCRRAERAMVGLSQKQEIDESVRVYLNRLSDFLFVGARFAAKQENKSEVVYHARKKAKSE
eukprot:Phypoly_transcript_14432.p1 GENE.Phypoly_transcript_14432~~Phypoly_transcript_14432.p1  ORF type:complete len:238 (+),score=30.78 Phypoly_transcript_14432:55-768(+)